jgi:hypothetical protein
MEAGGKAQAAKPTSVRAGFAPVAEGLDELGKLGLEVEAGKYLLIGSATFSQKGPVMGPVVVTFDFGSLPGRAIFAFQQDETEMSRRPISVISDANFSSPHRVAMRAHVSGSGDENIRVSDISLVALRVDSLTVGPLTES